MGKKRKEKKYLQIPLNQSNIDTVILCNSVNVEGELKIAPLYFQKK